MKYESPELEVSPKAPNTYETCLNCGHACHCGEVCDTCLRCSQCVHEVDAIDETMFADDEDS